MHVSLRLFGPPQVWADGRWQDVAIDRRFMLLAYLAVHGGWVGRDEVALEFWPDADQRQARANLRQLLHRARALPFATRLQSTPRALRWDVPSDVAAFVHAAEAGDWSETIETYRDDLLARVEGVDPAQAMSWVASEREALRQRWRDACLRQADACAEAGDHAAAGRLLRRVLERDELAEDVLQTYLGYALEGGQRQQALQVYRAFEERLARELSLEPLAATRQLVERLRVGTRHATSTGLAERDANDLVRPTDAAASSPSADHVGPTRIPSRLTTPRSQLIGREREVRELRALLEQPGQRMLTLVGAGGVGKTRLALEVARGLTTTFRHGCHDITCAAIDDADLVPLAIADRLGIAVSGREDPVEHLRGWLVDKQILLLIDNVEHLLDGCAFLADLVDACSELRLLLTSRESVGIAPERVFEVAGLTYPTSDEVDEGWHEAYGAARCYVLRAREQSPTFRITDADKPALLALCRYLRGNPLALELAAAWVRFLRPAEVLDAVRRDIDLLASRERTLSPRHDSLRAVFDHSWDLLTAEERAAMVAICAFRGGAAKEAVLAVTQAPLRTVLSLVNKSLLTRGEGGRFDVLEPLRRYTEDRAGSISGALDEARDRHARWIAQLMDEHGRSLEGGARQHDAFTILDRDWTNVRAAWRHACRRGDAATVAAMLPGHGTYLERRGRYHEGQAAYAEACDAFPTSSPLRARLDLWSAAFRANLGGLAEARDVLTAVLRALDGARDLGVAARTRLRLGMIERMRGDYRAAREHTGLALEVAARTDDRFVSAEAANNLGVLDALAGDLAGARSHFLASAEHRDAIGDTWGASISRLNLGNVERDLGRLDEAEHHYRASLDAARQNGNPRGVAFALGTLASIDVFRGAYDQAERRYREALTLRSDAGDRWGVAQSLQHLASVLVLRPALPEPADAEALAEAERLLRTSADVTAALGDEQASANLAAYEAALLSRRGRHGEAAERFEVAVRRATDIGHAHGAHAARCGLARALLATGAGERAAALFREVLDFAEERRFTQLQLLAVTGLAECSAALGDDDLARRASAAVARHPAAACDLRERAETVLERTGGDGVDTGPLEPEPAEHLLARVVRAFLATDGTDGADGATVTVRA